MIDPGSVVDWLQASLMAGALGGLAAAGRWALRTEEAERATPHVVPLREATGGSDGVRNRRGPAPSFWLSAVQSGLRHRMGRPAALVIATRRLAGQRRGRIN
jgi:hypothetical protein